MNIRDRTIGSIAAVLAIVSAPVAASAEATLTLPPEREAGMVLDADKASLVSVLDELATRTGMVIKGRRHISDREISGYYEGDMPLVLEALLQRESYTVILGSETGKGYTRVEKIIFTGQSERIPVKQVAPVAIRAPDEPKAAKVEPAATPEPSSAAPPVRKAERSPPPPPIPPQIDVRVLHAISRPPPDTKEGQRFDAAVEKTRKELEEALAPLRNLR